MSTMKTNIAKREKSLMAAKAIGSLMAIAVLAIVIFSTKHRQKRLVNKSWELTARQFWPQHQMQFRVE